MPRLSALVDDFAELFSFEATKLKSLARVMRENGLLTSGARGVNAPNATPLDAARLLIVMMLDSKLATVVEDLKLVGGFVPMNPEALTKGFSPSNLEQGLAFLIEYSGSVGYDAFEELEELTFRLAPYAARAFVWIKYVREGENGEEVVRETLINFSLPELLEEGLDAVPDSYKATARRFPVGFHQEPELRAENLIEIGRLVMGADQ